MNERKTITRTLFLVSAILFLLLRFGYSEDETRLFMMLIAAGLINVSILVYTLDKLFQIWLQAIANVIDYFIEEYFKEVEKREKERGKK